MQSLSSQGMTRYAPKAVSYTHLKRASLLCEKFATGGVTCDILTEKEIVRLINLVNNPSYTHLEDAETAASIPVLKGVM